MAVNKISPFDVYYILYKTFGPQGWWPVSRGSGESPLYHKREYAAKSPNEKFEICLGAILAQNTAWENAARAIANLNGAKALSLAKIKKLNSAKLKRLIHSSGYYNQKAERLKIFAAYFAQNYQGRLNSLFVKPLKELREELLSLKGIGPETADSIILYAAGRPEFVIDAYTKRLGGRLGWFNEGISYGEAQKYFVSRLSRSLKVYNEYHALIVRLGKDFCGKKPLCAACPLIKVCAYGKKH